MSPSGSSVLPIPILPSLLVAPLLATAPHAAAQQIPAGCTTSAVRISIEVFAADTKGYTASATRRA